MLSFNIESCCAKSSARAGTISTSHGKFQTPVFMPVGTYGAIKTNRNNIGEDITIPSGTNGFSSGPITINTGSTVTVNGEWVIL